MAPKTATSRVSHVTFASHPPSDESSTDDPMIRVAQNFPTPTIADGADPTVQSSISPLTTIFTPPTYCLDRFYITEKDPDAIITDIYSSTRDMLYRPCQPHSTAWLNSYSPAVCPYNMDIATVTSSTFGYSDSTHVFYEDFCCQRHVSQLRVKGFDYTMRILINGSLINDSWW